MKQSGKTWLDRCKDKLLGQELLDEMKKQEMYKIHADSMWLAFWGLFLALAVQLGMGAPFRQYAGESILFLLLAAVTLVRELRHGLWDTRFKPGLKTNLGAAAAAGAGVAAFNYATYQYPEFPETRLYAMAGGGIVTFLLTLALMQLCTAIYKRRHKYLEEEEPDGE